jgi:hypothetical protein
MNSDRHDRRQTQKAEADRILGVTLQRARETGDWHDLDFFDLAEHPGYRCQ